MTCESHPLREEGYRLVGAAFEVYNQQGFGLGEELYQESLEIELELSGIPFKPKTELQAFYKGRLLKKRYIPDLVVFGEIVAELKAVSQLLPEHEAQLINYLRLTRKPIGYLLNFGHKEKLEWKRMVLTPSQPSAAISED